MTPLEKRGIVNGHPDISTDSVVFNFKGRIFEVPTIALKDVGSTFNGYFYTAAIDRLKAWEKKNDRRKRRKV